MGVSQNGPLSIKKNSCQSNDGFHFNCGVLWPRPRPVNTIIFFVSSVQSNDDILCAALCSCHLVKELFLVVIQKMLLPLLLVSEVMLVPPSGKETMLLELLAVNHNLLTIKNPALRQRKCVTGSFCW